MDNEEKNLYELAEGDVEYDKVDQCIYEIAYHIPPSRLGVGHHIPTRVYCAALDEVHAMRKFLPWATEREGKDITIDGCWVNDAMTDIFQSDPDSMLYNLPEPMIIGMEEYRAFTATAGGEQPRT